MRVFRLVVVFLIAISAARPARAQGPREWVPQGIEALRQGASSKTEFALDHSMLVIASRLDPDDEDLRRVIAGVDGLSFHEYHYPRPWMYDPDALRAVRQEYRAAGWHELVDSHGKDRGPALTQLWVRSQHAEITNVAVLVVRAREVVLVLVSGSISPLELLHLGGHFGIPKIEEGPRVPNTKRRPPVPPEPPPVAAPPPSAELPGTLVEITSTPDGAEIELDGAYVGSTPSTITLAPGDHVIAVRKAGYAEWQRNLRITGGGQIRVEAQLEQAAPADGPR